MPNRIKFPPEIARSNQEEQLRFLREQRAEIEMVIAVLEHLEAVRSRVRQESAA